MNNTKMFKWLYCFIAILLFAFVSSCDTSEKDFEKAQQQHSVEGYSEFIKNHSQSELAEMARDSVVAIYSRYADIKKIPTSGESDTSLRRRLYELVEQRAQMAYEIAMDINSVEGWMTFIETVPEQYVYDANERIDTLREQELWATEPLAWKTASERNSIESYGKYIGHYPKGAHAKAAEKKLIDLDVAAVFAGEHGVLPSMDKGYSLGTSYSILEIGNDTEYEMTVSYSGPDSKRIIIQPYGTKRVKISNGQYMVAARVGHGVIPYAGRAVLDGSEYRSSFYIETSRY